MADSKKPSPVIRLTAETMKLLEPLAEAGVNVPELANEILRDNLKPQTVREHIDRKIRSLRKVMAAV